MTACRLAQYVDFVNPDDGLSYGFAPGDVLPDWADGLLTPSARAYLCAGEAPAPAPKKSKSARRVPEPVAGDFGDVAVTDSDMDEVPLSNGVPARPRGNGSRADWLEYAEALGIEVPSGAQRDDIVALVDALEA